MASYQSRPEKQEAVEFPLPPRQAWLSPEANIPAVWRFSEGLAGPSSGSRFSEAAQASYVLSTRVSLAVFQPTPFSSATLTRLLPGINAEVSGAWGF